MLSVLFFSCTAAAAVPECLRSFTAKTPIESRFTFSLDASSVSDNATAGASLYLDEMAFYLHAERVYTGALPVTTHGGRRGCHREPQDPRKGAKTRSIPPRSAT